MHDGVCYSCTQCDDKAKKRQTVRQHEKSVHEGAFKEVINLTLKQ